MTSTPRGRTSATFPPPVMEARRWLEAAEFTDDRPLINVSQAAPVDPPPAPLRAAMAEAITAPQTHLYGPVLGLPELRAAVAERFSRAYDGAIAAEDVAITAGCNQAFAAVISALCDAGDEVILPVPWYFNHKMWLDMNGVRSVPLETGADLLPDPEAARALITPRTRAIALVSPNNPAGVEYPPALLAAFRDLARDAGLRLILDETYRDFHSSDEAPHALFADPDWRDVLVQLYSFSKSYRLTGHRVGAIVADPGVLAEAEKFLDTVAICPPQLGQTAALWGLRNLDDWLAEQRAEILARGRAIREGFAPLADKGWRLRGSGAYFAYVDHPFDVPSADLAPRLVSEAGVLLLPGSMFRPEGDPAAARELRIAYANLGADGIAALIARLAAFDA